MATYTPANVELYITEKGKKLQVYNLPNGSNPGVCGDQYDLTNGITLSVDAGVTQLAITNTFNPGNNVKDEYNYANGNRVLFTSKIIIGTGDIRGLQSTLSITDYDMSLAAVQLKYNTTNNVLGVYGNRDVTDAVTFHPFDAAGSGSEKLEIVRISVFK